MRVQADTLMRKTAFPEGDASNNQLARYLYYTGRIKAVQLEYTDAFRSFFFSFITLEPRVE